MENPEIPGERREVQVLEGLVEKLSKEIGGEDEICLFTL